MLGFTQSLPLLIVPFSLPAALATLLHKESFPINLIGHTPSNVSAGWGGKTVYAIFTSKGQKYRDKLEAQLQTWAKRPSREHRYVAVGGRDYPPEWLEEGVVLPSDCRDELSHISCKEAYLIAEGAARQPEWLVIVGEDQYVDTERMERSLSEYSPDTPQALGCVGCGKGMYCPEVASNGGFCGGCGYAISRAALVKMLDKGAAKMKEYYKSVLWPNDMTTSCALYQRHIELGDIPGVTGYPIFSKRDLVGMINSESILTYHYLTPATMRFIYAFMQQEKDHGRMAALEADAFDRGCQRGMDKFYWHTQNQQCLDDNYGNWQGKSDYVKPDWEK